MPPVTYKLSLLIPQPYVHPKKREIFSSLEGGSARKAVFKELEKYEGHHLIHAGFHDIAFKAPGIAFVVAWAYFGSQIVLFIYERETS